MNAFSPHKVDPGDLVAAAEAWRPDADCIAAGDRYLDLAARCFAAAGLSDHEIVVRISQATGLLHGIDEFGLTDIEGLSPRPERYDAATAVARHCATVSMPPRQIAVWLGKLAVTIPGWAPDDPDEIAQLVTVAVLEANP